ncbi:putative cytochrome c oxidase subunit 3 [bacterium HR33]|nr:putative cytochrome c oxidase subunit 3 [bacterium HR33]
MTVGSMALERFPMPPRPAEARPPYAMGLVAIIASVTMLFVAFTAALLIRRTAPDWVPIDLPGILWWNTGVILASSLTMEFSRRAIRRGATALAERWTAGAFGLGVVFLGGQTAAWLVLVEKGVFLPSSPYASFFYLLSAVHGCHLIGGLVALGWCWRKLRAGAYGAFGHRGLGHAAIYWHFVGGLWLYVFFMLGAL